MLWQDLHCHVVMSGGGKANNLKCLQSELEMHLSALDCELLSM